MGKNIAILLGLLFSGLVWAIDSGIKFLPYDELIKLYDDLLTTNLEQVEKVEVAKSARGDPVWGYLIQDKSAATKKLVYITAAVHGNEYLNIEHKLFASFVDPGNGSFQEFFGRGGAVVFIPVYNVDGYKSNVRRNGNNFDLNRDYPKHDKGRTGRTQPETIGITNWVDEFVTKTGSKLAMTMEYHCCQERSTLLYPWSYSYNTISYPSPFIHVFTLLQKEVHNSDYFAIWQVAGRTVDGSSIDYWFEKYGALAFGFEGSERGEVQNSQKQIAWWNAIVDGL